jgi:hypothetical protein
MLLLNFQKSNFVLQNVLEEQLPNARGYGG